MNFSIRHIADSGIVEIVANGLVNHDARKEIICTASAVLEKSGCVKLLINKIDSTRLFDKQMSGALSIIKLMNELKISPDIAIAALYKKVEQYDEFFEVMAQVKGFSIKNFTSRDQALLWLGDRVVYPRLNLMAESDI